MDHFTKLYKYDVDPEHGCSSGHLYEQDRVNRTPMSIYTEEFFNRSPHLRKARIEAIRDYVLENGPFVDESVAPDLPKSNRKAFELRQEGNRLFRDKDFEAALVKYNESICWAETDSEDLGIGYANRSAVYYDMEEYWLSMENIILAKKHGYPQRLMPKLLARESKCTNLASLEPLSFNLWSLQLPMMEEQHPTIPFVAAGIKQKELPHYGRSMVANRAFKAGDVILEEEAMLNAIGPELKYKNCNYCSIDNFLSLIPCPKCVSVMYCSDNCRLTHRNFHRYECGITEKLHYVSKGSSRVFMGPKAFFYGLSVFDDNLENMIKTCAASGRAGADPFNLRILEDSYRQDEFMFFHGAKLPTKKFMCEDAFRFHAAVYYSIYIKHPLVRSIITTEAQEDFMLRCILDYMRIIGFLVIGSRQKFTSHLYSLASICNHSCDPNTVATRYYGRVKFIVIRPIRKGEQILISYGPLAREQSETVRRQYTKLFHFKCLCDMCKDSEQSRHFAVQTRPVIPLKAVSTLHKVIEDPENDILAKLALLQHFTQRYAVIFPQEEYVVWLDIYRNLLVDTFTKELQLELRKSATSEAIIRVTNDRELRKTRELLKNLNVNMN